jgi:hypothetical protein
LARHHRLGQHHRELVRHAREGDQFAPELHPFKRIGEAEFKRVLRHPGGARRGLDAGAFESRHQLLEALALDPAERPSAATANPSKAISYSFMPR